MKILIINNECYPIGGGGAIVTLNISEELVRLGHEVYIITSSYKGLPNREVRNGVVINRVKSIRRNKDVCSYWELVLFSVAATIYTIRFIKKNKPDVIHAMYTVPSGGIAYVLKKIFKIPYLLYTSGGDMPGSDPERYKYLYPLLKIPIKIFCKNAYAVLPCSGELLRLVRQVCKSTNIKLIPNGVDLRKFKKIADIKRTAFKILLIGRLIPRKGFHLAIKALALIIDDIKKPVVLEIIGTGPEEKNLKNMVASSHLDKYVFFIGSVKYDQLPGYYQQTDLFLSTAISEGMSCTVLEAMASGLPIIASNVSGNNELVYDNFNGYLFPPSDAIFLSKKLLKLINHENLTKQMGKNSLTIIGKYDYNSIVKEYIKIYKMAR